MTPTPKMQAVAVAGALATVVAYIATLFGVELPDTVVAALTALLTFGFGWLRGEHDPPGDHAA